MTENDRYEELFQDSPDSVYNAWCAVLAGSANPVVPGSLALHPMQDYDINMQLPAPVAADTVPSANPFTQFTTSHVPTHLTLTQDVDMYYNVHKAPATASPSLTLLSQPAAILGPFQLLQANAPVHTAPAPTPTPARTPPSHLTPNEWRFVYTTFESGSPDAASAQSEPATTTVSVVAMHVPSGPTQAQINGLNNQCSAMIKCGRLDICRALLMGTDSVPSLKPDQGQRSWQEEIVMAGLTIAGETATIDHLTKENCDKIWKTIVQTPSCLQKKNQTPGFGWPPEAVQVAAPSQYSSKGHCYLSEASGQDSINRR